MPNTTIIAALVGIIFTSLSVLIGLVYWNIRDRIRILEEGVGIEAEERRELRQRIDAIFRYLFGVEEDPENIGLSETLQDRFDTIEATIEQMQNTQETSHETEMELLETLINELHDADVEIERDDVYDDNN